MYIDYPQIAVSRGGRQTILFCQLPMLTLNLRIKSPRS